MHHNLNPNTQQSFTHFSYMIVLCQECSRHATVKISKELYARNVNATQNQIKQQLAIKSILADCSYIKANLNDLYSYSSERSCYYHPSICQGDHVFLKISSLNSDIPSARFPEGCYFPCMWVFRIWYHFEFFSHNESLSCYI